MRLLARITEPVLLSYIEALLRDAGIGCDIADRHISIVEGSIGAFPRRVLVRDDDWDRAARVMQEADLGTGSCATERSGPMTGKFRLCGSHS